MGIFTLCHYVGSMQLSFDLCREPQLREYFDSRKEFFAFVITVGAIKNTGDFKSLSKCILYYKTAMRPWRPETECGE